MNLKFFSAQVARVLHWWLEGSSYDYNAGKTAETRKQLQSLKFVPRLLRLIWRTSPTYTTINIVIRLLLSLSPLAMLYVAREIIDEVIALSNGNHANTQQLWRWVGIELAIAVASDTLRRAVGLADALLGMLFTNQSTIELMRHASLLDLYHFEEPAFYDKLEKARQQTNVRTALLSELLLQAQGFISLISLAFGVIAFSPWLIIILIVAVLPSFIGETYFNRKRYGLYSWWTPQRRQLDYIRYVGASDQTAKEVKIFNLSDFLITRYDELSKVFYQHSAKLSARTSIFGGLFFLLGTLAYYGAYGMILRQAVLGAISIGQLTFLAGSFLRLRELLQEQMNRLTNIASQAMYLQDYFEFFDIRPQIKVPENALRVNQPLRSGFVFENVGFRYPGSEKWANRHVSFTLRPGEKIALVGENGAGKTTLVKLLARLYDPTEGRILLDGKDLREYDLNDLRENIGVIFQDFVRYSMTAAENIAIGSINDRENEPQITDAARKSLAEPLIERLPLRYHQMLGKRFSEGTDLSGGEWQKIAIARAYMRKAQLLILDEPTAALDARAEHEVFARFAELMQGKAAVLISHRFSTVRMADRILYMEQGELKEIGTHQELLQLNGKYAELFYLQAKGYQ
jgi:ATP-binding cassette subfamily B protein